MKKIVFFFALLSLSFVVRGQFEIESGFKSDDAKSLHFVGDIGAIANSSDSLLTFYMSENLVGLLYRVYQPNCARSQYLESWNSKRYQGRLYYYFQNHSAAKRGDEVDFTFICFSVATLSDRLVGLYEKFPEDFPKIRIMMDKKALRPTTTTEVKKFYEYPYFPEFPIPRYALYLICQ